jgi:transcription initiation factor TFIIE subunit alpha
MSYINEKVLKQVVELFGEDAVKIVEILKKNHEITDDQISAQTELHLNDVRKILYRLYDNSLVALRRSRDKETGWFIFHWSLQQDQVEGFLLNQKKRILEKLESRLRFEKNNEFYRCNTPNCKRVPFDEAMELFFRCPTCKKSMIHVQNDQIIKRLTEKIDEVQKELT